jgi:hypothetical protein
MGDIFRKPNKTINYANPLSENGRKRLLCGGTGGSSVVF